MNDEIKEILDEMINLNDYEDYKIYGKKANEIGKLLLDYITNLQQENDRLREENNILKELNVCVGCENNYHKREIAGIQVVVSGETYNEYKGTLQDQISELENRIDKAINYLEEFEYDMETGGIHMDIIMDILRGNDNEQ